MKLKAVLSVYFLFHIVFDINAMDMTVRAQILYHVAHYLFIASVCVVASNRNTAFDWFLYCGAGVFLFNAVAELRLWDYSQIPYAEINFANFRLKTFSLSIGVVLALLSYKKFKQLWQQLNST